MGNAKPAQFVLNRLAPELRDAGKRASDTVNQYIAWYPWEILRGKYLAFRLGDGQSDGTMYDTKRDAVRHQFHEQWCAYFRFTSPAGATPKDMAIFLLWHREAYDRGARLPDPDDHTGGRDMLITASRHDTFTGFLR